jgi:hypothetical protein
MSLINCPECHKPISDAAQACPNCGFTLTPDVVALQKVNAQNAKRHGDIISLVVVSAGVVWAAFSGGAFRSSSPPSSSSGVATPKHAATSNYAADAARQRQLGENHSPTPSEIREYLILDAKQSVREGSMSKSAYHDWTKEKFSE